MSESHTHTHSHAYRDLYREVVPSVVSVYVPAGPDGTHRGAGSGFVYDADGHVVTNAHVVGGTGDVDVRFSDGAWRSAAVVGRDADTDLAVLRVTDLPSEATPLRVAGEPPEPGESVAALGNPLGLDGTITAGIVSGTGRSMRTREGFAIPDVVQTDAAINPGNSGGPLVTLGGAVVGVNRAKGGDNIGFAVSAALVERVVPDLIARGRYRHPYLQVRTVDVSPAVAEANDLDDPEGVLVVAAGPAAAVLRASEDARTVRGRAVPVGGDVIVAINGAPVRSHEELTRTLILDTRPGDEVELDLLRGGRRVTERLVLGERPAADDRDGPVRISIE